MTVQRRRGESLEALLKRFRREVSKGGVLYECKRRRYALSKSQRRRVKRDRARRSWYKRQRGRARQIASEDVKRVRRGGFSE